MGSNAAPMVRARHATGLNLGRWSSSVNVVAPADQILEIRECSRADQRCVPLRLGCDGEDEDIGTGRQPLQGFGHAEVFQGVDGCDNDHASLRVVAEGAVGDGPDRGEAAPLEKRIRLGAARERGGDAKWPFEHDGVAGSDAATDLTRYATAVYSLDMQPKRTRVVAAVEGDGGAEGTGGKSRQKVMRASSSGQPRKRRHRCHSRPSPRPRPAS